MKAKIWNGIKRERDIVSILFLGDADIVIAYMWTMFNGGWYMLSNCCQNIFSLLAVLYAESKKHQLIRQKFCQEMNALNDDTFSDFLYIRDYIFVYAAGLSQRKY